MVVFLCSIGLPQTLGVIRPIGFAADRCRQDARNPLNPF